MVLVKLGKFTLLPQMVLLLFCKHHEHFVVLSLEVVVRVEVLVVLPT